MLYTKNQMAKKISFMKALKVGAKILVAGLIPAFVIGIVQTLIVTKLMAGDAGAVIIAIALLWTPLALLGYIVGTGYFAARWWKYK